MWRWTIPLIAGVVGLAFFFNLQAVPLFDVDEGAFSEATREMLLRGDFISTWLNDQPRYDKPILIYWLQAASASLLGLNEFAMRLPSALAASLWVLLVYGFTRRVYDEKTALAAALITATAVQIQLIGRAATADALLNLFIAASMFSVWLFFETGRRRWLYGAFAAIALGTLTKGPVAILIPGAVSLIFFVWQGQWSRWWRAVLDPRALALFAVIALPWYVLQILKEGQPFIDGFFFKHNIDRFQGPLEGHSGSWLYYLPVVLLGLFPYTALVLRRVFQRPVAPDPLSLFLVLWFVFVLVFFSLSGTKLPHYTVYGYTGAILLMAGALGRLRSRFWALLPALLGFAFAAALPDLLEQTRPCVTDAHAREVLAQAATHFGPWYRGLLVTATVFTAALMVWPRVRAGPALLGLGILSATAVSAVVLPAAGSLAQGALREAAQLARNNDYTVTQWRLDAPSFAFYSRRIVQKKRPAFAGEVVLTKTIHLPDLGAHDVLYQKGGIALVRLSADSPDRKSTRLNSSHTDISRMPSSA